MQLKKVRKMRKLAPELDPLRIGSGWTKRRSWKKVQVMVEKHLWLTAIREADI